MKKAKKITAKKKAPKRSSARMHTEEGIFWYGVHIHHIGLGVAAVGTLVFVLLIQQNILY
ncbi:MAG TPA: hypothetical protein VLG12_00595 [Candidatus Saccharimonadales bacterium]|nr:hypothetical protein [Candidatus Saccharimonadales bacterium]